MDQQPLDLIQLNVDHSHRLSVGRTGSNVRLRVEVVIPGPQPAWREVVVVTMSRYQSRVLAAAFRAVAEEEDGAHDGEHRC